MPILRPGRHRARSSRRRLVVLGAFAAGVLLLGSAAVAYRLGIVENPFAERGRPPERLIEGNTPDVPPPRGVDADLGFPWAADGPGGPINTVIAGLTTFRGNAARSYYGEGPVPSDPRVLWRYPGERNLCMESTDLDETKIWCGMGWTGQPTVVEVEGGGTEIRFGAYDGRYHFLDGATGRPMRPDLITGDLAKGSATTDPDGYPLYYAGSRDNYLRIVALDRGTPTVLWSLDAATSWSRSIRRSSRRCRPSTTGCWSRSTIRTPGPRSRRRSPTSTGWPTWRTPPAWCSASTSPTCSGGATGSGRCSGSGP